MLDGWIGIIYSLVPANRIVIFFLITSTTRADMIANVVKEHGQNGFGRGQHFVFQSDLLLGKGCIFFYEL
jgi:hypothetical protein